MTLAKDMSPAEKHDFVKARDAALVSIHGFADWLEKRLPGMVPVQTDGRRELQLPFEKYLLAADRCEAG